MVGMEEGLFPISRALNNESELEEERRLCYVAITRAEKLLYITYAKIRTIYGNTNYTLPSRFIDEIPENLVAKSAQIENTRPIEDKEQLIRVRDFSYKAQKPKSKPKISVDSGKIKVGIKVSHKKWGIGTIVQVKDRDDDKEIVIAFDKVGLKRLLLSIAPIEILKGE